MTLIRILLVVFGFILLSCGQKTEIKKNENLIGFKSEWIGELGDEEFIIAEPLAKSKKIETQQIDDILIIKTWQFINTCGKYEEDIFIESDTINLKLKLVSDEVCTSMSIAKLTYIVDNPLKKEWNIK